MFIFANIFSSRSKYIVLRVLVRHELPLSLRQIAYLSEESLFSVQRSLKQLVDENLITRKAEGHRVLFSTNHDHSYYPILKELYLLEARVNSSKSPNLDKKAKSVLQFASETHDLIQRAHR